MSSAHKKVIVRRLLGDTLPGYLPLSGFVRLRSTERDRVVDLLDLSGRVLQIPLSEIKHICYVREFNLNDTANPGAPDPAHLSCPPPHRGSLAPPHLPWPGYPVQRT